MKASIWLVMALICSQASLADLESMRSRAPKVAEMKEKGLVGEQADGYLGVVKNEAGAQALADEENADRKVEYSKRSKESGQAVEVLAQVLGEARIRQEKSGRFVKQGAGWSKK